MKFNYNDGGRSNAGYKGTTGDCVTRAIAIATGESYQTIYDALNAMGKLESNTKDRSNSRTGVKKDTSKKYLESTGWIWTATMLIGQGCKVHLKAEELPAGRIIVKVSKHMVAVIDGIIQDTHDCSREETRCVYGYFTKQI